MKRNPCKPKKYIVVNDREGIDFETNSKKEAIRFIKEVSEYEYTSVKYFLFERIDLNEKEK